MSCLWHLPATPHCLGTDSTESPDAKCAFHLAKQEGCCWNKWLPIMSTIWQRNNWLLHISTDVTGFKKHLFQVGWAQSHGGQGPGEQHCETRVISYDLCAQRTFISCYQLLKGAHTSSKAFCSSLIVWCCTQQDLTSASTRIAKAGTIVLLSQFGFGCSKNMASVWGKWIPRGGTDSLVCIGTD